jgi:hypothetical protein
MAENPERWEVALTEEQRAMFGAKPGLLQLLTLARVVNALMFCFDAILRIEQDAPPPAARRRIAFSLRPVSSTKGYSLRRKFGSTSATVRATVKAWGRC